MRIHLLREENSHFLEWKIRDFSTGFDVAFCDVTKKEKIQVYYIDVTNLTDGKMNGSMNAEKTYELDREDSYDGKLRNQRIP